MTRTSPVPLSHTAVCTFHRDACEMTSSFMRPPAWMAEAWHWLAVGASSCVVIIWLRRSWPRKHAVHQRVHRRALEGLGFGASIALISLACYACARSFASVAWACFVLTRMLLVRTHVSDAVNMCMTSLSRELLRAKMHTVTACDDIAAIALICSLAWVTFLLALELVRWLSSLVV